MAAGGRPDRNRLAKQIAQKLTAYQDLTDAELAAALSELADALTGPLDAAETWLDRYALLIAAANRLKPPPERDD